MDGISSGIFVQCPPPWMEDSAEKAMGASLGDMSEASTDAAEQELESINGTENDGLGDEDRFHPDARHLLKFGGIFNPVANAISLGMTANDMADAADEGRALTANEHWSAASDTVSIFFWMGAVVFHPLALAAMATSATEFAFSMQRDSEEHERRRQPEPRGPTEVTIEFPTELAEGTALPSVPEYVPPGSVTVAAAASAAPVNATLDVDVAPRQEEVDKRVLQLDRAVSWQRNPEAEVDKRVLQLDRAVSWQRNPEAPGTTLDTP